MSIKAEVTNLLNCFTAQAEFTDTAISFYGPSWEIGLFFGLIPIRGKKKEIFRIEYDDIEEVVVGKNTRPINKKDACLIKVKNHAANAKNSLVIEVAFIPFEPGRAMLFERVGDRFV